MSIEDSIVGVIAVAAGALGVGARYPLASYIIERQSQLWGFQMGTRSVSTTAGILFVWGVFVAGCGVAVMLWDPMA